MLAINLSLEPFFLGLKVTYTLSFTALLHCYGHEAKRLENTTPPMKAEHKTGKEVTIEKIKPLTLHSNDLNSSSLHQEVVE